MKKLIAIVLAVLAMVGVVSAADITNDLAAAYSLYTNAQYAASQAAYAKVLVDYPSASVDMLASAGIKIGSALWIQNKPAEAQVAFQKVISDYSAAGYFWMVRANQGLAIVLRAQGKYAEAQAVYEKLITDYPAASVGALSELHFWVGTELNSQRKFEEAQLAFIRAAIGFDFISLAWQTKIMDQIKPVYLSKENYQAYLQKLLMIVPATAENAEFLGKVKSQLELLK